MTIAIPPVAAAGNPVVAALYPVIDQLREYLKVREQEQTARRRIDAWENAQIEEIRARAALVRDTLDHTFGERASIITGLLTNVSRAVESRDSEQLAILLGTLQGVVQTNPLAGLADLTQLRLRLDDPDQIWTL